MCGGEQVLGVKGRSGDPDGSRDGTLPLAGRFRFKHEPPQSILDTTFSRVHVGKRSGTKILRRPFGLEESSTGGFQNPSGECFVPFGL